MRYNPQTPGVATLLILIATSCGATAVGETAACSSVRTTSSDSFIEVGGEVGLREEDDGKNQFGVFGQSVEIGGGVSIADVNHDGWDDVIATYPTRSPGIFLNRCGVEFEDLAHELLPPGIGPTSTALVADFTGDGRLDLFLGGLMEEDDRFLVGSEGGFTDQSIESGVRSEESDPRPKSTFGATAADVDLDGDLDLFISRWAEPRQTGLPSQLLINDGVGNFHDGSEAAGLAGLENVPAFTATFANWDNDPFPELFLTGDFGNSRFYDAVGVASYEDRTTDMGLGTDENGMGSVVADMTADGVLDWFVGSIHFEEPCPEANFGCTGNRLFAGTTPGHEFIDVTDDHGLRNGDWSWGTIVEDLDHNGTLDMIQAGGAGDLTHFAELRSTPAKLWLSVDQPVPAFDSAAQFGLDSLENGRGLVTTDYDRDGDLDVLSNVRGHGLVLYRNEVATDDWLVVEPLNGHGIAATEVVVLLTAADGETLRRDIRAGDTFVGQRAASAHFGLATVELPVRIEVTWPNGKSQQVSVTDANQFIEIREPNE